MHPSDNKNKLSILGIQLVEVGRIKFENKMMTWQTFDGSW